MQYLIFASRSLLLGTILLSGIHAASAQVPQGEDDRDAVGGDALTPEQQQSIFALDVRLAGLEALSKLIEDEDYAAEVAEQIERFYRQRIELEEDFDPSLYESLMHSVISRYQIVALWLKPPRLPPPPTTVSETQSETSREHSPKEHSPKKKPCVHIDQASLDFLDSLWISYDFDAGKALTAVSSLGCFLRDSSLSHCGVCLPVLQSGSFRSKTVQ